MIKTVTLTGSEVKVTDLGGQNAAVKNLGSGSIYVSTKPNITAGADNVIEIPAGAGEVVLDTNGTVYIVGTGKVQCTGTPYAVPNFKLPSSSSGGGGGTSDVTKEYVDAQDTTNLNLAKAYTDNAKAEIQTTIDTVGDTLNTHIADQVKHITAEERAKWDAKADLSDIPDKLPADGGNADTVDGKHASDFALSDDNYWLYTFSEAGNKHGSSHRIYAKYNVKNDSRFYLQDEDAHHVRVNYADEAYTLDGMHANEFYQTANGLRTDARYYDIFSTSLSDDHACWNKFCYVTGQSANADSEDYIKNAPEITSNQLWYEVFTCGHRVRAYQIAFGCYNWQNKAFIRYQHDGNWSGWKNIADGGNASTATALTSSAGTDHIPVRFSSGKPVAVSEILKYNTGSLPHGDTTILYASGYKYALIFAYCDRHLSDVADQMLQPFAIACVGNMSSTTSYGEKPLTQSGSNSLSFTVTNGDIIIYNNGGENYSYLIIWSN